MQIQLPARNDTDGALLASQARYTLLLDMITRTGTGMWPRYGTGETAVGNWPTLTCLDTRCEPHTQNLTQLLTCGRATAQRLDNYEQPGIGAGQRRPIRCILYILYIQFQYCRICASS